MDVTNPFEIENEAARYQKYRPKYHHIPFGMIRDFVRRDFNSTLDVACGTGHSTFALAKISRTTIGCDLSESMLAEARKEFEMDFLQASAEDLPFEKDRFDLVNVSMGFHWLNQEKFLNETKRVLKKGGLLSIDDYRFLGKISDDPQKQDRHYNFLEEYLPLASRRPGYPSKELLEKIGMEQVKEIKFDHKINMSSEEFVNLIMTWSNFQIQEEQQKRVTAQRMKEAYGEIFGGKQLALEFGGKALLFKFL